MFKFIRKVNILLKRKSKVYLIVDINKKLLIFNNSIINQKTEEIRLRIRLYTNNIIFNIIITKIYDIRLELL